MQELLKAAGRHAVQAVLIAAAVYLGVRLGREDRAPSPLDATAAARQAGVAYAGVVVGSYADAWVAAAEKLAKGSPVGEAIDVVGDLAREARIAVFERDVRPIFDAIVPDGTPPESVRPSERAALAAAFRAFAEGLKAAEP